MKLPFIRKTFFVCMLSLAHAGCSLSATPQDEINANNNSPSAVTRTVTHALGTEEVPLQPKKIASTHPAIDQMLLALGVKPYASTINPELPEHFFIKELIDKPIFLGEVAEQPNLEAVLAAETDMILMDKWQEKVHSQLKKIAPTVVLDYDQSWRIMLNDTAKALGLEEKSEAYLKQYDSKIASAKLTLDHKVSKQTVMVLRVFPKKYFIYGAGIENLGQLFYKDLGLMPSKGVPLDTFGADLSMELLPQYNPDHLFVIVNEGAEAAKLRDDLMQSTLWKNLSAVASKQVYTLESGFTATGPIAWSVMTERIVQALTKSK